MTMSVQTFKNEELNDTLFSVENQEEWKEIAANLGMGSQLKFVESSKSPMPYPHINKSMENIFSSLCPQRVDFKSYDKTPIPLEVMKEISFCVQERYFDELAIWFDDKTPDPFVIGIHKRHAAHYYESGTNSFKVTPFDFTTKEQAKDWVETMGHKYSSDNQRNNLYLVARWADEMRPMAELKELAKVRLLEKYTQEWRLKKEEMEQKIKTSADLIGQFLNGEIDTWALRS